VITTFYRTLGVLDSAEIASREVICIASPIASNNLRSIKLRTIDTAVNTSASLRFWATFFEMPSDWRQAH
jgi:hypothetical protein